MRTGEELPKLCPLPLSKNDYKFNVKAKTIVTLKFTCLGNRKDNVTGSLKLENKKRVNLRRKKRSSQKFRDEKRKMYVFIRFAKGKKIAVASVFGLFLLQKGTL